MGTLFLLFLVAQVSSSLDRGAAALADFRAEEAIEILERAKKEYPHSYSDHVRLYEQLGIAHAYLDQKEKAFLAFDMMLALDPGHALSYTLSPKVTFLFEQARKTAVSRESAMIDLGWPRNLKVSDRVPIDIEVIADPKGFLKKAELRTRRKGAAQWDSRSLELSGVGRYQQIELPPTRPGADRAEVLQLYLVVTDEKGNQVFLVGDALRPREISLAYAKPEPWYGKWWVWALVGGLVAAGTGTAVYMTLREPPDNVGGVFQVP